MPTTTVDEFVLKIKQLPKAEREELVRRLNALKPTEGGETEKKTRASKPHVVKQPLHPNTIWLKENSHKYPGQYVALKDGKLIAVGRTLKEADLAAREKGVKKPMFHYNLAEGEEAWGGWG